MLIRLWLVVLFALANCSVGLANGNLVIYIDFSGSGLDADQRKAVKEKIRSKFDFGPDGTKIGDKLEFRDGKRPEGSKDVEYSFIANQNAAWGSRNPETEKITISAGVVNNKYSKTFDTPQKKINSFSETMSHELAHKLIARGNEGHNKNAPDEFTRYTDDKGNEYTRSRGVPKSDGNLPNGHPGLFANGRLVTPAEKAANERQFTDAEKAKISANFARILAGEDLDPTRKPADPQKQDQLIYLLVGDIVGDQIDQSTYIDLYGSSYIDVEFKIFGGGLWDFGYWSESDDFIGLIEGGVSGQFAMAAGAPYDFAIRPYANGAGPAYRMSAVGSVFGWIDPLPGSGAIDPIDGDYFRSLSLGFDLTGDGILDVSASLQAAELLSEPAYDRRIGFAQVAPVPVPPTMALSLTASALLGVLALSRHRRASG